MMQTKRERFLGIIVFLGCLSMVGMILYQRVGDKLFGMDAQLEQKQFEIKSVLDIQKQAFEINSRYDEMKKELTLPGSNPEQDAAIRKIVTDILNEVGLANQYGSITAKDQRMEPEFKVATISISQILCTPQQLGQLLLKIEMQSEVMDITDCKITNQISSVGKISSGRNRDNEANISPSGLLLIDSLQISRLIDYRDGEKPKSKRSRS